MQSVYHRIGRKPSLIILGMLLVATVFVLSIGKNARLVTDLDEYMPQNHPAFVFSTKAEEQFGIKDKVLLVIEHPESIYTRTTLGKIKSISELLPEQFAEIDNNAVTSLYTAENITADEFGLTVRPFYTSPPETEEEVSHIKRAVQGNDMLQGRIVSTDGTAALIVAEIPDQAFDDRFYEQLRQFARKWTGPENVYIAGRSVVEGELTKLGPKDMSRMAPLVFILMTVLLLFLLRSVRHTIINLVIVLFGTLTAFGLMTLFGVPVYTVSTMIPVMLIAIGVAYGIHMHNSIFHLIRTEPSISRDELVRSSLRAMVRPVTMTAVTTAVGFISLFTSEVLPVRYFGLFTALGVMTEMLLALILFPASIYLLGPPVVKDLGGSEQQQSRGIPAERLGVRAGRQLLSYPLTVTLIAVLVTGAAVLGMSRVWIDTSFLSNFQEDSRIVQTDRFVNRHFGGTTTLNVIFNGNENDTFKQPDVLRLMHDLQVELERRSVVGNSFAITDYVRRMNRVMHEDKADYERIPESREMVAQYLLLYEMSGDPENLNRVVDYNYKSANLTFQLKSDSSATMEKLIEEIEEYASRFEEHGIEIRYAGSGYKSLVFADLLLEGQIQSLALSFGIVALLLTLMFRSLWIGLAGTMPIAITAMVNFGTMGLLSIPLSSSTAIVSSIAIGIGVDYAIHLLERYRFKRREGNSIAEAAYETLSHTGRAIIYNAIAVMGGFAVLLTSVFPLNRQVGGLVALNMATSALGTLSVLLVVTVYIDRRTRIYEQLHTKEE